MQVEIVLVETVQVGDPLYKYLILIKKNIWSTALKIC